MLQGCRLGRPLSPWTDPPLHQLLRHIPSACFVAGAKGALHCTASRSTPMNDDLLVPRVTLGEGLSQSSVENCTDIWCLWHGLALGPVPPDSALPMGQLHPAPSSRGQARLCQTSWRQCNPAGSSVVEAGLPELFMVKKMAFWRYTCMKARWVEVGKGSSA